MKYLLQALILLLFSSSIVGQSNNLDSLKQVALSFYQKNDRESAEKIYQEIILYDTLDIDVIFNLGIINLELGNEKEAIYFLQKAVILRDREAAKILKEELSQEINYSEIMHADDVDEIPKYIYKDKELNLIEDSGLNHKLTSTIIKNLRKSEVIKDSNFSGKIYVTLEIERDGSLICKVLKGTGSEKVDIEIKTIIENSGKFSPGKYQNIDVGVYGWNWSVII